jgi:hypothetical protein
MEEIDFLSAVDVEDIKSYAEFKQREEIGGSLVVETSACLEHQKVHYREAKRDLGYQIESVIPKAFRKNIVWELSSPRKTQDDKLNQPLILSWKYKPY